MGIVASDRNGRALSLSLFLACRINFSIDSRFGPGSIWLSRIPGFGGVRIEVVVSSENQSESSLKQKLG